jgi:hypothetical protein
LKGLAEKKRARAQFFTPPAVAGFIWRLVSEYVEGDLAQCRVIDPSAGEGVFLDVGLRAGLIRSSSAFGIELDEDLAPAGRAAEARWFRGDALTARFPDVEDGTFDVVVGNPPFGRASAILPKAVIDSLAGNKTSPFVRWRAASESAEVEQLFLERALQLVRPRGLIAFIMPDGFLANERAQAARDWALEHAAVLAVVSLPAATFRTSGLNATTSTVILRRHSATRNRPRPLMAGISAERQESLAEDLNILGDFISCSISGRRSKNVDRQCFNVNKKSLCGNRWDVPFCRLTEGGWNIPGGWPLARLGEFVEHITYGPIVTGRKPTHVKGGVPVVLQGDFTETGLKLSPELRVKAGSEWDPLRSRVVQGDLLLPRSGSGSLGRNRLAVYLDQSPANVGCFVDLVRLSGVNPFYVWFYFRSTPGWSQIRSLLNGVGTPNINFSEIRALQLPVIPDEEQSRLQSRYVDEVLPLHKRGEGSPAARNQAFIKFQEVVGDLERFLGVVTT